MTDLASPRFTLPLLALAQAQKELVHNEALARIDMLLHPLVEEMLDDPKELSPEPGMCWLIGANPGGIWASRANQIAGWTDGGWRYIAPTEGMTVRHRPSGGVMTYREGLWLVPATLASPVGGSVVDVEARDSLAQVIALLERAGLAVATPS